MKLQVLAFPSTAAMLLVAACGQTDEELEGESFVVGRGVPLSEAGSAPAETAPGSPGGTVPADGSTPADGGSSETEAAGAPAGAGLAATGAAGAPAGGAPGGGGFDLNPAIAQNLKADPSQFGKGKVEDLVTFQQLSLVGVDLDQLLDYLFEPESENAKAFAFPESVEALDGKECAVIGYMIPLEYKAESDEVTLFMLVRDLMACCFGGTPRPDEWIYVEMETGKSTELHPYVPIVVRGELEVGRIEDEFGFASGVYAMKSDGVERFE